MIAGAIEGFVKPAYGRFHAVSSQLRGEMDALCADQSPDKLAAAQSTFLTLVDAWSEVETIRFGPVTEENRLERILFWPDRKSIGLKQVQAALAGKDASATDPATLKDKSVAMQGLGALEFVLFGTGSEALAEPGDPYRCAYGAAIASNIEDMAAAILAGWQDPAGIARQWANPAPDNPLYRTDEEAMTELFNVFVHGLEMVRDVRLNGFLGDDAGDDKPKQAVFWRSGGDGHLDQGEFAAGCGPCSTSPASPGGCRPSSGWIAQSIGFEFDTAEGLLDLAAGPIVEVLEDKNKRQALAITRLITSHLSELFGVTLAGERSASAPASPRSTETEHDPSRRPSSS